MQRSNLIRKSSSIDQNYERNLRQQSVSYLPSVFLSYIPVLIIFLLNTLFNALFPNANSVLHTLILIGIFASSNLFGYSVLSAQVQFFPVYWRASLLANGFLIGFLLASGGSDLLRPFGLYTMSLSFFHMSEFVFTALYNHREVSTDSFLLNHSVEYGVAALASWIEFTIEALLCPSIKLYSITLFTGLVLVSVGELFRKLAMYTAGRSFNHYVQEERQSDHVLVTKGVYAIARHPSYLGWFIWSVGTQVLLANPVCAIIYTIVSWKFFKNRIVYEEYYLIKFFGKQYTDYQKRVWSGIPFVRGFLNFDEALD